MNGTLLTRAGGGWRHVKAGDSVAAGTTLVSLFEADLKSQGVAIKLLGDIGQFGPLSVLDAAVRILDADKDDAALALERGVVVLTNTKDQGAAKVLLKMRGEDVHITLKTPGAKVGIELHGRHPGGLTNILKDDPTTFVFFLVGKGEAVAVTKAHTYTLMAPPGPALIRWDSVTRQAEVAALETFPEELVRNDKEKQQFAKICAAAAAFNGKNPTAVAASMVKSDDALERLVGVTALGAVDDVPHLLAALGDPHHKDVREQAVLVLRAWMGRSSGQLKPLRVSMLKQQYPLAQMKMTMHLLFGFDEQERDRPVIYELLLHLLDHKSVAVRELAHWHLVRLAPAGRDIAFDAGAADEDRQKAAERWRKLIPAGELPPRLKSLKKPQS
ncbi:MAG: hypothetical protein L0Y71_21850 [Gemmataceae bacterium]|nr:hypothetical protein [Gemmataceae bacterium]